MYKKILAGLAMATNNRKKVTLSVDRKIYDDYMRYCEERGMIMSKHVEFFMKEELERMKRKK
ncbi:MAG: hypothetical protein ABIA21_01790 [Candidatus Aenigmatarchaeota archaeon]